MSSADAVEPDRPDAVDHDTVPPARTGLLVLAGVLLALPVVALMWVSSYSRDEPRLAGFPFFIWYQFLWVFLCSALTYTAYRIVLVARPHRPMDDLGADGGDASGDGQHPVRRRGSGHEQRQRSRPGRPHRAVRARHRHGLLGHAGGAGRRAWSRSTSGAWAGARSAPGSPGSCSAATSTRPTRSSRCRRRCSRPARWPGSSRCPTRSCSTRSSSSSWRRLWSVSHRHGYVTTADFVRGRFGSRGLSLAVAVTGFLATMPYIALQLVGIQAVLEVVGLGGGDNIIAKDLPLFIAFALLAAYTYSGGLRAPAVIAFVKDTLIYLVIIVAIIYLPTKFGGWDAHLRRGRDEDGRPEPGRRQADRRRSSPARRSTGPTPRSASARRWRCSCTRTRSPRACRASTRNTVRRNAAILPAYSFVLGLLALLGWVAIAAGTKPIGLDGKPNAQLVIPQLFEDSFPSWFAGVAFAAIAIGALVPAAIMSIAAANTFTRNIYKEWLKPDATPQQEAKVSKLASLVVKAVRAGLRAAARQAERDQLPAARRHLDPADLPDHRARPLHPVVAPLGPARRLGGRHGLRHLAGVERHQPARRCRPLRRLARADAGHRPARLHRPDGVRHQPASSRSC